MKGLAFILSHPGLYSRAGAVGRWLMKHVPGLINNKFNPWYKQREMPDVPKQSFTKWYQQNRISK